MMSSCPYFSRVPQEGGKHLQRRIRREFGKLNSSTTFPFVPAIFTFLLVLMHPLLSLLFHLSNKLLIFHPQQHGLVLSQAIGSSRQTDQKAFPPQVLQLDIPVNFYHQGYRILSQLCLNACINKNGYSKAPILCHVNPNSSHLDAVVEIPFKYWSEGFQK